jgi:transcriptional regulator with XRE-family HTH domain
MDLPAESKQEARESLNQVVRLLKKAGVSQNELARSAGYSPGYITQLLSDKYPIEKLSPAAIASLVTSAYGHARTVRRLSVEDARELEGLLSVLATNFSAARLDVFGMDGEFLDRDVVNYMNSDLDERLAEDINEHAGYGFVQVVGSPGQGKTWALAHLDLRARLSHEVCWVDFERLGLANELKTPPHAFVGAELRRLHQRYFRALDNELRRHGQATEVGAVRERLTGALASVEGDSPQLARRRAAVVDALERVLDGIRAEALRRPGAVLAGEALKEVIDLADRYVNDVDPNRYIADDLAEDLSLLVVLVDAVDLLSPESEDATPSPEPRKLLVLIDAADRSMDPSQLTQTLRELKTLVRFNPELRRVLVIVSKTIDSVPHSAANSSSSTRSWYSARSFTDEDVEELMGRLRDHGWFRAAQLTEEKEELLKLCELLSQFNRRATCLYLDHTHSAQRLIGIDEYLGDGRSADIRIRRWIERWAQHVTRDLNTLVERPAGGRFDQPEEAQDQDNESAGDRQDKLTYAGVIEWCRWVSSSDFEGQDYLPLAEFTSDVVADEFCRRYGLLVDGRVPYLQRRVARRVAELAVFTRPSAPSNYGDG